MKVGAQLKGKFQEFFFFERLRHKWKRQAASSGSESRKKREQTENKKTSELFFGGKLKNTPWRDIILAFPHFE
jgi:hypothetical protein